MHITSNLTSKRGIGRDFVILFILLVLGGSYLVSRASDMSGYNLAEDADNDGLTNAEEKLYGTDPTNDDTDGDGYSDGIEVSSGFNPLKKAPGDKIVAVEASVVEGSAVKATNNMTQQVSEKIAEIVRNPEQTSDGTSQISLDQLDAYAQQISGGTSAEITLPDVDVDSIKIKDQSYPKLSKDKKKAQVRQDVIEYLTTISYIFASNSPQSFKSEDELSKISDDSVNDAISAISSGNFSKLQTFTENGDRMLSQVEDVEVPQAMLDVHVKALKLAKYAALTKDEIAASSQDDPIKTMQALSKTQGFLNTIISFVTEVQSVLSEYEIDDIPLDL
ncbi:MAG TPA: hypothetical protein VN420_02000 [Candidatus Fimivivens sp.]|nr:hypothetical protein [Candidatus Fimivivens sp.]